MTGILFQRVADFKKITPVDSVGFGHKFIYNLRLQDEDKLGWALLKAQTGYFFSQLLTITLAVL